MKITGRKDVRKRDIMFIEFVEDFKELIYISNNLMLGRMKFNSCDSIIE